jgi:hypothetical protein
MPAGQRVRKVPVHLEDDERYAIDISKHSVKPKTSKPPVTKRKSVQITAKPPKATSAKSPSVNESNHHVISVSKVGSTSPSSETNEFDLSQSNEQEAAQSDSSDTDDMALLPQIIFNLLGNEGGKL